MTLWRRRGLGYLPDKPDVRDIPLATRFAGGLPPSASLRHPAVIPRDQGSTSSCVGFAWAQALELAYAHKGVLTGDLSPLYLYFLARSFDGTVGFDQGTYLRSAAKAIKRFGAASEKAHAFGHLRVNRSPSWRAYRDGYDRRGLRGYYRVSSVDDCRHAIASGFPVVGGWLIDEAFTRTDGIKPVEPAYREVLGGHALVIIGYSGYTFDLLNSWSSRWGNGGYCRASESFISTGSDLWALDVSV